MNRLIFLSFLTQAVALINLTSLHNLSIDDCDLVPKNRYRSKSDSHYFIGTDGSVTASDASHIFALLHCSLPLSNRSFIHSLPVLGDISAELCNECSPFSFIHSRIDRFRVPLSSSSIESLCRFLHFTAHPRNSVVILFMEPFDCNITNNVDSNLRRVIFFQTTTGLPWFNLTGDRIAVHGLNLDLPSYLTSIHSSAYYIIARLPPRLEAFMLSLVPAYTQEQEATIIATMISLLVVIGSTVAFICIVCTTAVYATEVREHYAELAAEWNQLRNAMLAQDNLALQAHTAASMSSISTARPRSFTAISISSCSIVSRGPAVEDQAATRAQPDNWDPFADSSYTSDSMYWTPTDLTRGPRNYWYD